MATIEVKVPDIGDFKDVPVIELLVKDARGDVATDRSGRPRTQPFARPDDPHGDGR